MRLGLIALAGLLLAGAALAQNPAPVPAPVPSPAPAPAKVPIVPTPVSGEPRMGPGESITAAPHPLARFTPVTDDVLRRPDPNDWLMLRGNYEGYGFSTLKQVDRSSVKGLQLVWARAMENGINQAAPLVYKGVMFLANPGDVIQALDAVTGELLWQHRRALPRDKLRNTWGQRKRSVFLYGDKLYFVSWDNFLVALDAKTGRQVWEVARGGDFYVANTMGPIVVNGIVLAGSSCQEAPFGCFVTGNDAETGKELWRNFFIPRIGEKGDETWGKAPFEKRWMTGMWGPITHDPATGLIFYGSSGVGPAAESQRRQPGATLYGTNTRYAVQPRTGKIVWQHQVLPRDNWDQECTFEMLPVTTPVNIDPRAQGLMAVGRKAASKSRRTLVGVPCKTGILWSFDLAKGDFLWAKSNSPQNLVSAIDDRGRVTVNEAVVMSDLSKRYYQCPGHAGGRDWPFTAYSPERNVLYIQSQNLCADMRNIAEREPVPSGQYHVQGNYGIAKGYDTLGRIDAVSLETGRTLWTWNTRASNYSPILATAGGLLFNGGMDRYFRAFDQENGTVLWQTRLGSQASGTPVTYSVKGRQYVAVVAGGGYNRHAPAATPEIDQPSGSNMVYVFALPETPQ